MATLKDSLDKIKEGFVEKYDELDWEPGKGAVEIYCAPDYEGRKSDDGLVRLRLDWELSHEALKDGDDVGRHVAELMLAQAENDLADMIENGDIDNTLDPLYKALDGAKKRGKQPINVEIPHAQLVREEKKKSVEYTMFILLKVDWEK